MPVITVSRQTGSGGATIGKRLAERLDASYLNTQIIHEVARRLGISEATAAARNERAEVFAERLARTLWLSDPSLALGGRPVSELGYQSTTEAIVAVTRQLVREVASSGNAVIFGHGAQYILADQPDALHVRFVAPFPARVARVMRRLNLERADAERHVREQDQRRANYIRQFYGADWNSPEPYHLILNTALMDQETCMAVILLADEQLKGRTQPVIAVEEAVHPNTDD